MDLSKLIAEATKSTEPITPESTKIVREPNEPSLADILERNDEAQARFDAAHIDDETEEELLEAEAEEEEASTEPEDPTKYDSLNSLDPNNCAHLCDCDSWFTHGPKHKCRFPDLVKHGLCPKCLDSGASSNATYTMEDDFKEDAYGKNKLSPKAQVLIRNKESQNIKNMTVEQLTHHITYLAFRIEEMRVQALQTRHRRTELEEEMVNDLPESERKAFIEALRLGKEAKKKKVAGTNGTKKLSKKAELEAKEATLVADLIKQGRDKTVAKVVAGMMIKTGKSQAFVEAMLND